MIYTNQRIEGFVCHRWLMGPAPRPFLVDCAAGVKEGWLQPSETVFEGGLAAWPGAFRALFRGTHMGKVVVRAQGGQGFTHLAATASA